MAQPNEPAPRLQPSGAKASPGWTPAMVTALASLRARGRKWYRLYDKVHAPEVLRWSWGQVAAHRGAAGGDFGRGFARHPAERRVALECRPMISPGTSSFKAGRSPQDDLLSEVTPHDLQADWKTIFCEAHRDACSGLTTKVERMGKEWL